jgi:hypothetical protein
MREHLPELGRKVPARRSGDIRPRFLWFGHKFSGVLKHGPSRASSNVKPVECGAVRLIDEAGTRRSDHAKRREGRQEFGSNVTATVIVLSLPGAKRH